MLTRRGEDNSTCWVVKPKTTAWKGTLLWWWWWWMITVVDGQRPKLIITTYKSWWNYLLFWVTKTKFFSPLNLAIWQNWREIPKTWRKKGRDGISLGWPLGWMRIFNCTRRSRIPRKASIPILENRSRTCDIIKGSSVRTWSSVRTSEVSTTRGCSLS